MNLIVERSAQNKNLPKVYAFSTFFYTKLITCGYSSLQRWTKKVCQKYKVFAFLILFRRAEYLRRVEPPRRCLVRVIVPVSKYKKK